MPCPVSGSLEWTQVRSTEKWSLERTQIEKWSLEQTLVYSSAFIQRVGHSSEHQVRSSERFRKSVRIFATLSLLLFPSPFISTTTCNKFRTSCPLLIHTILISMTFLIHSSIYQQPIQTFNGNKYNPNL